jgi:hypothetical protein
VRVEPLAVVRRELNAGSMRCTNYWLSNGWYIYTAQSSQDRQGRPRFSIWRPDTDAFGGAVCMGGAATLKFALMEANRLWEPMAPIRPQQQEMFQETHP